MDKIKYRMKGTCASTVYFDVEDNIVKKVVFEGGCMGKTQGVARLSAGHTVDELISLLDGIQCGYRGTSCPDQFAQGLKAYKAEKQK